MSQSTLTCAGGRIAFAQLLGEFGNLAAYWFVAAQQSVFRDGVILWSSEGPVVILLRERQARGVDKGKREVTCCVSGQRVYMKAWPTPRARLRASA